MKERTFSLFFPSFSPSSLPSVFRQRKRWAINEIMLGSLLEYLRPWLWGPFQLPRTLCLGKPINPSESQFHLLSERKYRTRLCVSGWNWEFKELIRVSKEQRARWNKYSWSPRCCLYQVSLSPQRHDSDGSAMLSSHIPAPLLFHRT